MTVPLPCRRVTVPKLTAYEKEMLRQGQFVSLNQFLMPGDMFVIESGGERFATVCISSEWRKSAIRRITPDEVVAMFGGECPYLRRFPRRRYYSILPNLFQ